MATIDISSLQTFSASDLLKLTEYAIGQILAGVQSYAINGRQFTKADLGELYDRRNALQQEVASQNDGKAGGGNVLVRFGETA